MNSKFQNFLNGKKIKDNYGFGLVDPTSFKTQSEYLKLLRVWGFKTSPLNKLLNTIEDIEINHRNIEEKRRKVMVVMMEMVEEWIVAIKQNI